MPNTFDEFQAFLRGLDPTAADQAATTDTHAGSNVKTSTPPAPPLQPELDLVPLESVEDSILRRARPYLPWAAGGLAVLLASRRLLVRTRRQVRSGTRGRFLVGQLHLEVFDLPEQFA